MAVSRKDWSALSSLARQRTLEDEEEAERERRRRHRNLSSTTDDEAPKPAQNGDTLAAQRLPSVEEAETPKPWASASRDEHEDIQAILRTRQERRQRRQVVEAVQAPSPPVTEEGRDGSGPQQATPQLLPPKKEVEPPPRRRLSRERRGPWAREEECVVGRESEGGKEASEKPVILEKPPVPGKTLVVGKRLVSEETFSSEKVLGPEKTAVSEKRAISEKKSTLEKTSVWESPPAPGKTSDSERRRVSEKASLFEKSLVSEKTTGTETKLAPKRAAGPGQPQAGEQLASGGSQPLPITGQSRKALPEKSPRPSAELGEQGPPDPPPAACRLPPVTLQVKIPSKEEEVDTLSPTQATYSSSLKRSSPRTISFRMSSRKDNSEATLTRSASMRLPAGAIKLGEKLERYHTAVQRSESVKVKSPGSSRTEFFVAPVGVASKRHLFEKELVGQSRVEPASSRKENLRLSGVVTSRLNLWISRTQESGDQDPQEVRKEPAATKRTQWGKKAEPCLDAELCKAPAPFHKQVGDF